MDFENEFNKFRKFTLIKMADFLELVIEEIHSRHDGIKELPKSYRSLPKFLAHYEPYLGEDELLQITIDVHYRHTRIH